MAAFNLTTSSHSTFILEGIPGMEVEHIWISIPFSMFYSFILLGNSMVLFVVIKEQTLHKPMYLLFCILALTDIGISTCVMPKALGIFWFGFKDITVDACVTQLFFLDTFCVMHSAVLVTMAFDRYVAICEPLRYATILTNVKIAKLGLLGLIRAVFFILPETLLLRRLPFCTEYVIPHTYCKHMAVVNMSCGDTTVNRMYNLVMIFVIIGTDLPLVGVSYSLIFRAVIRISSKKTHQKALNTCTAHISVILICYTSTLLSVLTHMFGDSIPAHVHILLDNLSLLVPAMLNPIIYGAKTKELRDKVGKYICIM